jgi:hypothetical protein
MKRYGWQLVTAVVVGGLVGCTKAGEAGGRDLEATTQATAVPMLGSAAGSALPTTQVAGNQGVDERGLGERDLVAVERVVPREPAMPVSVEAVVPAEPEARPVARPVQRAVVTERAAHSEPAMPAVASSGTNSNLIGPPVPVVTAAEPVKVVDPLVTDITRRAAEGRGDMMAQLDYQLLQYLRGQTVPDVGQLSQLAEGERELVMAFGDALANLRALPADARLETRRAAVLEMTERLASAGGLAVSRLMLCSEVTGFGQYKAMDAAAVAAGREMQAVVYVEVANLRSKLQPSQEWETRLSLGMSLHAASGAVVWQDKPAAVVDICRNRRRDFFVSRLIRVPALVRGDYVLRVTVTDANSGLVTEATLPVGVR